MPRVKEVRATNHTDRVLVFYDCGCQSLNYRPRCYLQPGKRTICPKCSARSWDDIRPGHVYVIQTTAGKEYNPVRVAEVFPAGEGREPHLFVRVRGDRIVIWQSDIFRIMEVEP